MDTSLAHDISEFPYNGWMRVMWALALAAGFGWGGAAVAQPTASLLPDAPSAQRKAETQPPRNNPDETIFQEPGTTGRENPAPLRAKEKWDRFVRTTFQPSLLLNVAFSSGIKQGLDSPTEYGQGAAGYGKRYGATLANSVDGRFWGAFVFPVLFHEDPRYFRLAEGGGIRRIEYAATRSMVTRTDSGESRFNFSNVLGNLFSAAISNAYYPEDDRGAKDTLQRAAIGIGIGALRRVGQEFAPDIRKKFQKKKKQP